MDKYIEVVREFIHTDKNYIDDLATRYPEELCTIGQLLVKKSKCMYSKKLDTLTELLDFLDGNGFIIENEEHASFFDLHPIKITPIYTQEIIYEEDEYTLTLEFSIQEEVLPDPPVEMVEGSVLEHQEFYTPRQIRIRIRGRLEFLRLVSKSRRGGSSLPRPP